MFCEGPCLQTWTLIDAGQFSTKRSMAWLKSNWVIMGRLHPFFCPLSALSRRVRVGGMGPRNNALLPHQLGGTWLEQAPLARPWLAKLPAKARHPCFKPPPVPRDDRRQTSSSARGSGRRLIVEPTAPGRAPCSGPLGPGMMAHHARPKRTATGASWTCPAAARHPGSKLLKGRGAGGRPRADSCGPRRPAASSPLLRSLRPPSDALPSSPAEKRFTGQGGAGKACFCAWL